jgi:hypothetical protein
MNMTPEQIKEMANQEHTLLEMVDVELQEAKKYFSGEERLDEEVFNILNTRFNIPSHNIRNDMRRILIPIKHKVLKIERDIGFTNWVMVVHDFDGKKTRFIGKTYKEEAVAPYHNFIIKIVGEFLRQYNFQY